MVFIAGSSCIRTERNQGASERAGPMCPVDDFPVSSVQQAPALTSASAQGTTYGCVHLSSPKEDSDNEKRGLRYGQELGHGAVIGVFVAGCGGDTETKKSDGGKTDSAVVLDGGKADVVAPGQPDLAVSDGPTPMGQHGR